MGEVTSGSGLGSPTAGGSSRAAPSR